MRHVFMRKPGLPSALELVSNAAIPQPRRGQVRVRMLAAGVSFPDATVVRGTYPAGQPAFPLVPGYDGVGRVDAVGEGVSSLAVGDAVAISSVTGCWSEYAVFPVKQGKRVVVTKVDLDGVRPEQACALVLNGMTALQMLTRVRTLQPGQRVLIHGVSGGVGSLLADLAVHMGLAVWGTCSTRKLEQVRALPFGDKISLIDYTKEDFVAVAKALPAPAGFDAVFDAVAGDNFTRSSQALRRGGLLVAYGLTAYDKGTSLLSTLSLVWPYFNIAMNPLSHVHTAFYKINSLRMQHPDWFAADFARLVELVRTDQLHPQIHERRFTLDEASEALDLVVASAAVGKVVIHFDDKL